MANSKDTRVRGSVLISSVRAIALTGALFMLVSAPRLGRIAEAVEEVEAVEVVEPVDTTKSGAPSKSATSNSTKSESSPSPARPTSTLTTTLLRLLGHLHAAVIHLPIAWSLLWACTELAVFGAQKRTFDATGAWLSAATTLSFAPAVTSGLLRFGELSELSQDPELQSSGGLHRNLMYAALALSFFLSVIRLTQRHRLAGIWGGAYAVTVVVTAALIGFSAHLGGVLVYGAEFFAL